MRPIDADALKEDFCSMPPFEIDRHDVLEIIGDQEVISLNTLRDAIYEDAVAHGLWEYAQNYEYWPDLHDDCIDLIAAEVCEMGEVWNDKERFVEELADVVIMCFSVAGRLGIDIDAAIRRKMEINKKRPWKHGKE